MKDIPNKIFYTIGDVSKIVGVKEYVLRYWETEFPGLKPEKGKNKQRIYRKKDIEYLLKIKDLLYNKKYTIKGALKILRKLKIEKESQLEFGFEQSRIDEIKKFVIKELEDILKHLKELKKQSGRSAVG